MWVLKLGYRSGVSVGRVGWRMLMSQSTQVRRPSHEPLGLKSLDMESACVQPSQWPPHHRALNHELSTLRLFAQPVEQVEGDDDASPALGTSVAGLVSLVLFFLPSFFPRLAVGPSLVCLFLGGRCRLRLAPRKSYEPSRHSKTLQASLLFPARP